jgi:osmoprotectant transport system substrate-binding protein
MLRSTRKAALAVAASLLSLSACGLGTAGGFIPDTQSAGELKDVKPLDGLSISVGSKNFTEQILLGKIAAILLRSKGADVEDLTNIPGSVSARQAIVKGKVDLEWMYTGTAWISYLGHDSGIPDSQKQYEAVRAADKAQNDLVWFKPAPMNNTYGFATPTETAKKLGISKLSDLAKVPAAQRTFCVESEFASRNDGFQPMLKKYGIPLGQEVKRDHVRTLDTGAIYAATDRGDCTFGEVFTTDGRIKALDLTVLKDDRAFFPKYNVAVVVRQPVLDDYPQLRDLFAPVSAKLTDDTLIALNAKVDVEGQQPVDVALDWLRSEHFVR